MLFRSHGAGASALRLWAASDDASAKQSTDVVRATTPVERERGGVNITLQCADMEFAWIARSADGGSRRGIHSPESACIEQASVSARWDTRMVLQG